MCRLSIIVPYDRDEAAFETTLVSVLENRPEYCEILVAHDGAYNDPFDLGDEVRFVVSEDGGPQGLVRAGVRAAMGRIVHILGSGARATESWTEEPASLFEQTDLGFVAPVICDVADSSRILAAGWSDQGCDLRTAVGAGRKELQLSDLRSVQGVYLDASFWRRSLLEAVCDLPATSGTPQADYLWSTAARMMGWRCRISTDSVVLASKRMLARRGSVLECGKFMQQVRFAASRDSILGTLTSCLVSMVRAPLTGASWSESLGRMSAIISGSQASQDLKVKMRQAAEVCNPQSSQSRVLSPSATRVASRRAA